MREEYSYEDEVPAQRLAIIKKLGESVEYSPVERLKPVINAQEYLQVYTQAFSKLDELPESQPVVESSSQD